jgi:hypothetical protein
MHGTRSNRANEEDGNMKKVLLSTTALVAAGLLVTSVAYAGDEEMAEEEMMEEEMAAEPISVGISGYAYAAFGASTHSNSPQMYQLFDPGLSGSATMDNGLTFGVSTKLQSGAEHVITVDGAFGSIQLGQARSARGGTRIASAGATGTFGLNGPYQGGVAGMAIADGGYGATVGTNDSGAGIPNRDAKIIYKSPSVGGIQIGASYAPGGTETAAAPGLNEDMDDVVVTPASSTPTDQIAAALTFTQALGDASVSINVGYETGNYGAGNSPSDLNAGASVALGGITVSGGVRDSDDDNGGESMQTEFGASMAMGAVSLSAGWGSTDSTDMYALGAAYPLGEGVALETQLDFGDNGTDEWVQFMIGTVIGF